MVIVKFELTSLTEKNTYVLFNLSTIFYQRIESNYHLVFFYSLSIYISIYCLKIINHNYLYISLKQIFELLVKQLWLTYSAIKDFKCPPPHFHTEDRKLYYCFPSLS